MSLRERHWSTTRKQRDWGQQLRPNRAAAPSSCGGRKGEVRPSSQPSHPPHPLAPALLTAPPAPVTPTRPCPGRGHSLPKSHRRHLAEAQVLVPQTATTATPPASNESFKYGPLLEAGASRAPFASQSRKPASRGSRLLPKPQAFLSGTAICTAGARGHLTGRNPGPTCLDFTCGGGFRRGQTREQQVLDREGRGLFGGVQRREN